MTGRHHACRTALGGLALVLLGATTGCSALAERLRSDEADPSGSPAALDVGMETVTWGLLDQTASVVVRNDTDLVLRRGTAIARAVDRQGTTLATSATMPDQDACCAAVDVAPDDTFGFYFTVDDQVDHVDHVEVDWADVAWSPDTIGPSVTATPVDLEQAPDGVVAVADLTTTGGPVGSAVVQARLDDAEGNLVTIVSGRWACLVPDQPVRARMQLFHFVPEGTVLASVSVFVSDEPADGPAGSGC